MTADSPGASASSVGPGIGRGDGPRVGEEDEAALLARIVPLLPVGRRTLVGSGDDAAVVAVPSGRMVVSSDVLVEDHHFRRRWSTGADVGWRAAVQNLADVAAMGAEPTALVASLVLPRDLPVAWVVDLAEGMADACHRHGAGVVGGDLSAGEHVVVAVTVHGELDGRDPVLRSGAKPGDVVALAGVAGRSAAGFALLQAAGEGRVTDPDVADLVTAFRRPDPPVALGVAAAQAGATAMIDVSDGLLRDAGRIAAASGVVVDLDPVTEAFPADLRALARAADRLGADASRWVLTGGEDHGLLATFPAGAELPAGFRAIGRVRPAGSAGGAAPVGGASPIGRSNAVDGASAVDRPRAAGAVLVGGRPVGQDVGWDHFGGG